MKVILQKSSRGWIGLLGGLVMGGMACAYGQSISPQTSPADDILGAYRREQFALAQERQSLESRGATIKELAAWRQQNAARIQAQQERAKEMALDSELKPIGVVSQVTIPANASSTLEDFLVTQATLASARAQIHNELLQAMSSEASEEDVKAMRERESEIFQEQHAKDMALQRQRAQLLAASAAPTDPDPPNMTRIPSNASPGLRAYLVARDEVIRSRAEFMRQYLHADPATREAAIEQWRQENAGRLKQWRELAENMSNANTDREDKNQ